MDKLLPQRPGGPSGLDTLLPQRPGGPSGLDKPLPQRPGGPFGLDKVLPQRPGGPLGDTLLSWRSEGVFIEFAAKPRFSRSASSCFSTFSTTPTRWM